MAPACACLSMQSARSLGYADACVLRALLREFAHAHFACECVRPCAYVSVPIGGVRAYAGLHVHACVRVCESQSPTAAHRSVRPCVRAPVSSFICAC
eukprot:6210198-Pleurochrysis_carterae.AAC.1